MTQSIIISGVICLENKNSVRKSLRLAGYDYNTPGAYFITFCTHNRKHTLSRIVGAIHESPELQLTDYGRIVDSIMQNIPEHLHVTIDQYVIMPNHIHLIATITEDDVLREIGESPQRVRSILSKLIGYIKMNASKSIRRCYGEISVWQRGYYDHVIRDRDDYEALAEYIHENPIRWELDRFYSAE